MSKLQWKGSTLLAPVPAALVSCGTLEKPNALTIAWTGITCSDPPMTYISVRPERYSYDIIKESGEFVINLTSGAMARATDFCGVRSGREMDKLAATGLTVEPAKEIAAPVIAQSPLALECRVKQIIPLGSHDMFLAEIVAVDVEERLLDEAGKLHLEKTGLMAYSHGEYFAMGKKIGSFGYSVRKKRPKNPTGKGKISGCRSGFRGGGFALGPRQAGPAAARVRRAAAEAAARPQDGCPPGRLRFAAAGGGAAP
ncbi:MAG: flavin reductase family protein [Angelakisella sp.]